MFKIKTNIYVIYVYFIKKIIQLINNLKKAKVKRTT